MGKRITDMFLICFGAGNDLIGIVGILGRKSAPDNDITFNLSIYQD